MAFGKKKQPPMDPVAAAQAQRAREEQEVNAAFQKGVTALRDFIAPSSLVFENSFFHIGTRFARTFYVYGYPRQVFTGWLSSMVNLDEVMDLSIYVYPVESQVVLENLRKKVTQLEAGLQIDAEKAELATRANKQPSKMPKKCVTNYKLVKSDSLGLDFILRFMLLALMNWSS